MWRPRLSDKFIFFGDFIHASPLSPAIVARASSVSHRLRVSDALTRAISAFYLYKTKLQSKKKRIAERQKKAVSASASLPSLESISSRLNASLHRVNLSHEDMASVDDSEESDDDDSETDDTEEDDDDHVDDDDLHMMNEDDQATRLNLATNDPQPPPLPRINTLGPAPSRASMYTASSTSPTNSSSTSSSTSSPRSSSSSSTFSHTPSSIADVEHAMVPSNLILQWDASAQAAYRRAYQTQLLPISNSDNKPSKKEPYVEPFAIPTGFKLVWKDISATERMLLRLVCPFTIIPLCLNALSPQQFSCFV